MRLYELVIPSAKLIYHRRRFTVRHRSESTKKERRIILITSLISICAFRGSLTSERGMAGRGIEHLQALYDIARVGGH